MKIARDIHDCVVGIKGLKLRNMQFEVCSQNDFPLTQQTDVYNCGVFVCCYMMNFAFDEFIESLHCNNLRLFIILWIMEKHIPVNALRLI